ncbi:MAG: hypothetical protein V1701_04470 [Planctomycetota bacterium]
MQLLCPNCSNIIKEESISIPNNTAKCTNCDKTYAANELTEPLTEKDLCPPDGSAIKINKPNESFIEIIIPKRGVKPADILRTILLFIWGILPATLLILVAILEKPIVGLVAIPWCIVISVIIVRRINAINETQIIKLGSDYLIIRKQKPVGPKEITIKYADINNVRIHSYLSTSMSSFAPEGGMIGELESVSKPIISYGTKEEPFCEWLSLPEKKWAVKFLNAFVINKKKNT